MTIWVPRLKGVTGPRYREIAEAIGAAIQSGELQADQRLPTHRSLAEALEVTTGTVTRAYGEAERKGWVYGVVGRGTFVRGREPSAGQWQFLEATAKGLIELNINRPLNRNRADMLSDAMAALTAFPKDLNRLLDYQPDVGIEAHREVISQWVARGPWRPGPDQLVISNGGQHAILVALMTLTRAGDTVLCEALTYPGFTAVAHQLELSVRALVMDEQGILPEALEAACRQHGPRVLFCTPTLQNPTTATMSPERRQAVLDICEQYGVTIIEDDVSAGLWTDGPAPLAAMVPERVVHIGSFSKTLAGGLRVGYLVAPRSIRARIGAAVRATCWMASPLMVALVCEWIRSGAANQLLESQREELAARLDIAREILTGYQLRGHPGGLHLWLILPDTWRGDEFVGAAERRGVLIMGAATFTIGRQSVPPHAVRISLGAATSRDQLRFGLVIIRDLLRDGSEPAFPAM